MAKPMNSAIQGKVFEATGAYDWVWYIDIVLAVGAALIHLPIREAHRPRSAATRVKVRGSTTSPYQ